MRPSSETLAPVASTERIAALDIIRGLALFGVLQINLIFMSGHVYRGWAGIHYAQGWGGATLTWVRDLLLEGKSMSCFSMLFGLGLCLQMERAKARDHAFAGFAFRRLAALALLGIAHAVLIWNGDILLAYAVTGMILLPFLRARPRTILVAAGVAFVVYLRLRSILLMLHAPDELLFRHWMRQAPWLLQSANHAFGQGTWLEACRYRVWEWRHLGRAIDVGTVAYCLPLFLLGLALWRSGILQDPEGRVRTLRRIFHATFWAGLAISIICQTGVIPMAWFQGQGGRQLAVFFAWTAGPVALALGYLTGIPLLLRRKAPARLLAYVAPLGRMALTNYLCQSLVGTWVFNSYGLGLWARVTPSAYICGGLVFYGAQMAWSHWWLARFRFGPAEWLWRSMSYGQPQPFRIPASMPMTVGVGAEAT